MAFRDNIGVQEELKVELQDCSLLSSDREWLMYLMHELILLRNPLEERPRLDKLIEEVRQKLG